MALACLSLPGSRLAHRCSGLAALAADLHLVLRPRGHFYYSGFRVLAAFQAAGLRVLLTQGIGLRAEARG